MGWIPASSPKTPEHLRRSQPIHAVRRRWVDTCRRQDRGAAARRGGKEVRMRSFRSTLVVGSAICMLLGWAGSAMAGGNPPGNNGTVKVSGLSLGQSEGNESHVGCSLDIEFFGF